MPTINFPAGPSLNDTYNLGVRTWKWNGDAWALQPLTGGFTGSQGYTGSAGSQGAIGYTGSAAPNTMSDLVDDTSPQLGGDLESNGNSIKLPDSATVFLGTNQDMQILHDGSSSVIKDVQGNQLYIQSTNFNLANSSGLKHIYANNDYGVTMYYQDSAKLETTSSGVSITGALTVGGVAITPAIVPTISSISPSAIETSTSTAVTITGTNFTSIPQVEALNSSTGIWYPADSIAFTNSTTIVATFTLSVNASYKLRIENPDGNAVLSSSALLSVSAAPTFSTSAGSLGSIAGGFSGTVATLAGSSDSAITFSETTNVLTNASQANCSLNSSTGAITTTNLGGSSTTATTYNFTVRITDAESQTVDRSFSISTSYGATGGAQFN